MSSIRNNDVDTYKPWILPYVLNKLDPIHQDTTYTPTNYLCVIQNIKRKLEINNYTQNAVASTTDCDNEIIVADGKHSIKCYFKGLLGTMYIENKIIDLKSFHIEIDQYQHEVYFVVSCSQIRKPNLKIIDIYNICTININADTNIQKLLFEANTYNQYHDNYDNYNDKIPDTFSETFPNTFPDTLTIPFTTDYVYTNEPPNKRQKLNSNQNTVPQPHSEISTYHNLPKFSLLTSDGNTFTNCNNAANVNNCNCNVYENNNNFKENEHNQRYNQRINTFCSGIMEKMKSKPVLNTQLKFNNNYKMNVHNITNKDNDNNNRKINAFADDFDDENQYAMPKKNDNICDYNRKSMSPPPQTSVFCPQISSQ